MRRFLKSACGNCRNRIVGELSSFSAAKRHVYFYALLILTTVAVNTVRDFFGEYRSLVQHVRGGGTDRYSEMEGFLKNLY